MERASDKASTKPIYEKKPARIKLYLALKRTLFFCCKWIGLFRLTRRITENSLRIICYHGFSIVDESQFSPRTFIEPDTFADRLHFLKRRGFPVISIDEALNALEAGSLPRNAVVITIDDGFYSTYFSAWPILREYSAPATVYITTYYSIKGGPVFRLAVQYMFWKTRERNLITAGLGLETGQSVPIETAEQKSGLLLAIIRYGEKELDESGRQELAALLGERLGIDYRSIVESRILSIMNAGEIAEIARGGMDVELHSHRHDLPLDREAASREIEENRAILEPIVGKRLRHFCYPSGFYRLEQLPWLGHEDIASAVTCESGLNYSDTPKLRLKRFVDGEDVSAIEFEAEMEGFAEVMRHGFRLLKRTVGG